MVENIGFSTQGLVGNKDDREIRQLNDSDDRGNKG